MVWSQQSFYPRHIPPTLTLSNVQPGNAGTYSVFVTNAFGSAQSSNAVLTVTGGGSSNSCTPPPSGIAAWWPAEGNGSDIIGGNTATLHSGATFAPGEVGQAFLLNGTNDYLSVPASSNLNVAAGGSLTAEAWIKVSDVAGYHPIVEWNDGAGHGGVHMWILPYTGESAGVLFANLVDTNGGSHSFHSPGGSVATNVFQHVAVTYDQASGLATLYVNGTIVAQVNFGQFAPQTSYPFWMGYRPNVAPTEPNFGASLGGLLDEPSLYNRALSQNEIAAIYNAGANGKCGGTTNSGTAPVITHQPTNQTVIVGTNSMFSVTATGTAPLHYQWYGPTNHLIPGAITSTLTLSNVQQSAAGVYFVSITNQFGFATSSNAVLTVTGGTTNTGPTITHQPTNQTVVAGANATFSVSATGSPAVPLHFQWYGPTNGSIPGAITSMLTLSNVQPGNAGSYFVIVTNVFGSVTSSNAVLTVTGGGSSSNSCTPAPSGLIGLWRGDNNLNDSAGNNDGVAFGGPISYATGEVNTAFHYTNGSGYVEIPAVPALNVGTGAGFTIEGWIQPADLQNQLPLFEWQYNTNNDFTGTMFWTSVQGAGRLYANITESNNISHELITPPGILTTNYQHVALTYDKSSGVAAIYRNGIIVASANLGSFTPNTSGNLLLGERTFLNGNPVFHYAGDLDEMSLYSRALSSNEIAAIYFTGPGGKCPPVITPHSLISPQPVVNMSVAGNTPVLSWPVSAADFVLQSADSLTPPIKWTNVPATLQTNGNTIEATLPTGGQHGFFRLYQP